MGFDDGRLEDPAVLDQFDPVLRGLAAAGARVRAEAAACAEELLEAVAHFSGTTPRAVIAAGPDSRLLRAVLEPVCPVPFLAWPGAGLPGWAGSLDLVVVLAPLGDDPATARGVAEAVRRGCMLVVAAPAASLVARHTEGRDARLLPTTTGDQLATAVVMLELLDRLRLAPQTSADRVAAALDEVAVACSPHHDLAVNPAKILASSLADTNPLLWGGTVLAARAARRVAESIRRATGRAALAADAEHLLPVLRAARPADVFADPFTDQPAADRPALVVLADELDDPVVAEVLERLTTAAREHGVRVEQISSPIDDEICRYAALLATGTYAATYLRVGAVG